MSRTHIGFFGARWLGLRQALRLLALRPWAAMTTVVLCAVALSLPLLAVRAADAVAPLASGARLAPEISVFIAAGTNGADIKAMQARVQAVAGVREVRLIGRDAALAELRNRASGALPDLSPNPLPDVLTVALSPSASASQLEAAAAAIRKLPRVESVHFDAQWYRQLAALVRAGMAVAGLLSVWAAVLVFAILVGAVRVQAEAASTELRVLQLVGAESGFIRRPYVYAGALLLGLGGAGAVGLNLAAAAALDPFVAELADAYGATFVFPRPTPMLAAALIAASLGWGAIVASIGTRTAPAFRR
jgi:cell division transport system permease protein